MDRKRNEKQYTLNPDTGRRIVVNGPTWRRLSTKYYTNNDGSFTDELIPDQEVYPQERRPIWRRRNVVRDPKYKRFVPILVGTDEWNKRYGTDEWNKRYLEYEWDGHKFGAKRKQRLPKSLDTVDKRRQARSNQRNAYKVFDRKVSEGRLTEVVDSSLGYAATYYHTLNGNMD